MRSLLSNWSDRLVRLVVPSVAAQAAGCTTYNCGCGSIFRLKNRCCTSGNNVACTGCLPQGFC